LLAPAGTPRAIVNRLNKEWNAAAAMPDTLEKMQIAGIETLAGTPEQLAALIRMEIARWARVVKDANISIE
jgi:tripartite-type tricarboxylate transporter receptor subunit TctC